MPPSVNNASHRSRTLPPFSLILQRHTFFQKKLYALMALSIDAIATASHHALQERMLNGLRTMQQNYVRTEKICATTLQGWTREKLLPWIIAFTSRKACVHRLFFREMSNAEELKTESYRKLRALQHSIWNYQIGTSCTNHWWKCNKITYWLTRQRWPHHLQTLKIRGKTPTTSMKMGYQMMQSRRTDNENLSMVESNWRCSSHEFQD